MQVQSLDGEDPLEEGKASHSSILAWRMPWTGSLVGYSPWGHTKSETTEQLSTSITHTPAPSHAPSHLHPTPSVSSQSTELSFCCTAASH